MPLTPIEKPFDDLDYLFENKWDGYRSLAFVMGKTLTLKSRNLRDITGKYPEMISLFSCFTGEECILDGELCILDPQGRPDFSRINHSFLLQDPNRIKRRAREEPVTYLIWDILYFNGEDLRPQPLSKRRERLEEVVTEGPYLRISRTVLGAGKALFQAVKEEGLEGVVAKKKESPYLSQPNPYWLKIKSYQFLEAVIGGYAKKGRSLLVGEPGSVGLRFLGQIPLALKEEAVHHLYGILSHFTISSSPFQPPSPPGVFQWVRPVLTCRVRYLERTAQNRLRQAHILTINWRDEHLPSQNT